MIFRVDHRPDTMQRRVLWASGALGAAIVIAGVPLLLTYLPLPHDVSDAIAATYAAMLLVVAVQVALHVKAQCQQDERHRVLMAEAAAIRKLMVDLLNRNLEAIEDRKVQHTQREWNAIADGAEMVLGGRDVVDRTGTSDISGKVRSVVPLTRNRDCRS